MSRILRISMMTFLLLIAITGVHVLADEMPTTTEQQQENETDIDALMARLDALTTATYAARSMTAEEWEQRFNAATRQRNEARRKMLIGLGATVGSVFSYTFTAESTAGSLGSTIAVVASTFYTLGNSRKFTGAKEELERLERLKDSVTLNFKPTEPQISVTLLSF